ncbi:MAG: threonine/serine exporter family protein [Erysipelotrichaceae bacterium]
MIVIALSSYIATFGFGILFNIRGKKLFSAALGGSIGAIIYTYALQNGMDEVIAMLVASIVFSIFSEICARIYRTPVTTYIICALIPLVPGKGMYNAMVQAVAGDTMKAMQIAFDTLSIAGALALGIILVSTLTRLYFRMHYLYRKDR